MSDLSEAIAAGRQEAREDLVSRMHETLREWFEESTAIHPLPHGSFFEQIRTEVSKLEAEVDPDGARAWKIKRKKVPAALRTRVFKRDRHTCQDCDWSPSRNRAEAKVQHRGGHFLVAKMVVSEHDGGKVRAENLRTSCSFCTQGKPGRPGVEQPKNPKGGAARPAGVEGAA